MEEFASDTEIMASVTKAVPHLHPFTLARVFGVTRELATARLKTMQERGLVEKMKNGQYKILRAG